MHCREHNHRLYLFFRPQTTTGALWRTQSQTVSVLQTTDNYRCIVENTITDCICSSDHRQLQVHCREHNHRLYLFFRPQTTTGALWRTQPQTVSVLQTRHCWQTVTDWFTWTGSWGSLIQVFFHQSKEQLEILLQNVHLKQTLESGCHL